MPSAPRKFTEMRECRYRPRQESIPPTSPRFTEMKKTRRQEEQERKEKKIGEKLRKVKSESVKSSTELCRKIITVPKVVVEEESDDEMEVLDEEFEQWYQENFWGNF